MPDDVFADTTPGDTHRADRRVAFAEVSGGVQAAMLLCNALPLFLVIATTCAVALTPASWPWRVAAGLAVLYLLPPVATRLLLRLRPLPSTRIRIGRRGFLIWWASACLQVIYARFPMLEEALRLVPGLYSMWLRLWGSSIGRRTYWAPGTAILDRSFLVVGDDVVLGSGVRLNPHVLDRDADGAWWLIVAPVIVGHRSMVGGYSLLTAGSEIADDEVTKATLLSPPFSRWQDGRRRKIQPPGDA